MLLGSFCGKLFGSDAFGGFFFCNFGAQRRFLGLSSCFLLRVILRCLCRFLVSLLFYRNLFFRFSFGLSSLLAASSFSACFAAASSAATRLAALLLVNFGLDAQLLEQPFDLLFPWAICAFRAASFSDFSFAAASFAAFLAAFFLFLFGLLGSAFLFQLPRLGVLINFHFSR